MSTWRERVDGMYDDGDAPAAAGGRSLDEIVDTALDPLGPEVLLDIAAELGLAAGWTVLDIGARDGRHLVDLQRRFGCTTIGVEPAPANLARRVTTADGPVRLVRALAEALPLPAACVDLIWVRDVLVHIPDLQATFAEIARVARPGASAIVFAVFATERLHAAEADELWPPLAVVPASADRANLEAAVAAAGLAVERHIRLDGQWREHGEEHDSGRTSRQLLRIARLRRDPARYRALLGDHVYDVELADCLYGVYQLLGKLSASIYVLRAASRPVPSD